MGDINIKQVENLRLRMQILENLTLLDAIGIAISVYLSRADWTYWLVVALGLIFVYKYYTRVRLRKKEFLSNIVEQRTMELRFQRDKIQAESHKLQEALSALAEAQDELVRKEKLASVGQLTQGLVDRILNPLNYINNFATLSASLVQEVQENLAADRKAGNHALAADSEELLVMLKSNLDKIEKHGGSTVRIVKAMEELLKDRSGNRRTVEINEVCKVNLDSWKKNWQKELTEKGIICSFSGLSVPLTMELNTEQIGRALQNILNNSLYALLKKSDLTPTGFIPHVSIRLQTTGNQLQLIIRDNGTGIEEGIKNKVFSPFFTTKPTGEATGTGLYLSREVVLNHKGKIEIASEKDRFTEVTITLPIYA